MKVVLTKTWGFRLLAVFLILWGLIYIFPQQITFPQMNIVLGVLALAAGVLILIDF